MKPLHSALLGGVVAVGAVIVWLAAARCIAIPGVGHDGEPCFENQSCMPGLACGADGVCRADGLADGGAKCSSDCPTGEMVTVQAGSFVMGCNSAVDLECNSDESPYHTVDVPAFEIDKYEVTTADYQVCVDSGVCTAANTGESCNYGVPERESHPINCVDWNQAKAYCEWAGKRLPTEAEWEKAARGTDGRKYPWGNSPTVRCDFAVMDDSAAGGIGCGSGGTMPVGSMPAGASPYGAEDMVGNVWEWVEDWYHDSYSGAPTDGSAWVDPAGSYRVLRGGGCFYNSANDLRASKRDYGTTTNRHYDIGFRCSRDGS
jgi:formylglycine-generating enzyme required for sulfatase activity